jgi:serine/threonine-protein kinase
MSFWSRIFGGNRDPGPEADPHAAEANHEPQTREPASSQAAFERVGEPGAPTGEQALALLASVRDTPDEGRVLELLVRASLRSGWSDAPSLDTLRLACARLLLERGKLEVALELVASSRSIDGMMLAAELCHDRGELARAVCLVERVLARDIDAPGARERHQRWCDDLGVRPRREAANAGATVVAPDAPKTPYRLLREVARGGAGVVYEADEELLGRRVAFKIYHRGGDDQAQIRREARMAVKLRGPGVLRVLDADPSQGWIASEWIARGSLRELIARGDPELVPLSRWALPLARGLARIHHAGFAHGDLKPANVLMRAPDDPLLADFGICLAIGEANVAGTPGYVAPERLAGAPASPRDDVYAFGRILEDVLQTDASNQASREWHRLAGTCLAAVAERPADGYELAQRLLQISQL